MSAIAERPVASALVRSIILVGESGEVTFNHGGRSPAEIRAAITEVKDRLLAATDDQRELRVEHEFVDGMYLRKLHIPKGTLLVGKIHRQACHNVVASGDISILTEAGARRVLAGFTGASKAGIQKLGYAHEDTIFINVFRTDETDPDTIESVVACESYDIIEGAAACLLHG